jgi:DNA-binding beta-propeller fold protein YncE
LAIDQKDRIWITNAIGDTVTRFPTSDPSKIEVFKTGGASGKGMAIDSQGNAWITNTLGEGLNLETKLKVLELKLTGNMKEVDRVLVDFGKTHKRGNIAMLRPDGTHAPGSPFTGGDSLWGAWGAAIDGNDQVWVSNLWGSNLVHLCGVRTDTCAPGMKTGDPISPLGGYVGGDMQWLTDVSIDPAGNVWVADNWQDSDSCFGHPPEAVSTRCGGNGVTVFYGMAKPVRAPQIGPVRLY